MQIEEYKVDLYIRVSTDRQVRDGDSLEEQESELKKYCEYRGFKIGKVLIEKGKSAGNTNRPEYQRLIEDVKAQRINAVVVKKLDRLSRSLLDFEQLMNLLQENNVDFISLKESFDTSSALGRTLIRITSIFAQFEREQTSERITDVMTYRASQGLYNGGYTPYGYTALNKEIVPYKKEKDVVLTIFDKFLETESTTAVARYLNSVEIKYRNDKEWDCRQIQKIVQNKTYTGKLKWNGEYYDGLHQPLIPELKFEKVQYVFDKRHRVARKNKSNGLLQRLLYCPDCENMMTPTHTKNRYNIKYSYYRCPQTSFPTKNSPKCRIRFLPLELFDEYILDFLVHLATDPYFRHIEEPVLKHNHEKEAHIRALQEELQVLRGKMAMVKSKKDHYFDTLLSGDFTSAERKKVNERIDEMDLEEKQMKSQVFKNDFNRTQLEDQIINLKSIRQDYIKFRSDFDLLSRDEIRVFMHRTIKKIGYLETQLWIEFQNIPFPVLFPVRPLEKKD